MLPRYNGRYGAASLVHPARHWSPRRGGRHAARRGAAGGMGVESARFGRDEADARARWRPASPASSATWKPASPRRRGDSGRSGRSVLAAQHDAGAERRLFDQLERPGRRRGPAVWRRRSMGPPASLWPGRGAPPTCSTRLQGGASTFSSCPRPRACWWCACIPSPSPVHRAVGSARSCSRALLAPAPGGVTTGTCCRRVLPPRRCGHGPTRLRALAGRADDSVGRRDARRLRGAGGGAGAGPWRARQRVRAGMLATVAVLLLLLAGPLPRLAPCHAQWRAAPRHGRRRRAVAHGLGPLQRALDLAALPGALPLAPLPDRLGHASSVLRLRAALPAVEPARCRPRCPGGQHVDQWRRSVAACPVVAGPAGRRGRALMATRYRLHRGHWPVVAYEAFLRFWRRQRAGRHPALRPPSALTCRAWPFSPASSF